MNESSLRCAELSDEFLSHGEVEESLILLERAIISDPTDADLVAQYVERTKDALRNTDAGTSSARLERLVTFIRSRLLFVALDRVKDIARLAKELEKEVDSTEQLEPSLKDGEDDDETLTQLLHATREGNVDAAVLPHDIGERLRMLELARDSVDTDDTRRRAIEVALEQARAASTFDAIHGEVRDAIKPITKWSSVDRAARALQQLDGALGPLVASSDKLDSNRLSELDDTLQSLRDAATTIANRSTQNEADLRWKTFVSENLEKFGTTIGFRAPQSAAPDRACQNALEVAQALHESASELFPLLRNSTNFSAAREYAAKVALAGTKIVAAQQHRYESWAMERIRSGWAVAEQHIGIVDDEKKLGETLVYYFGNIDTRILGHEVQRCFTEVFDLLYARLDKPGKARDFDSEGNKLYVLSKMLGVENRSLKDF